MIFTLSMAFIVASVFLYTEKLEKKEISAILKNQNVLAQDLLDQISVSYDNSLLVQEIGQATSEILGSEKILDRITNIMAKHLKFDRGMIFLANKDRNRLVYANGYGFDDYLEKYLKSISFHLDNPSSKGEMVRAFREQKPFMVIDANKTRHYLSERTKDFVTRLETDSFICVPIVHEGKSLGVLAVDAPQSGKPPSQSDVNLILGIATQIGASLNSVVAYQKLRESEERFRNLSENIPDIIATIDMEGRIAYTNPAVEKILGYQCEEMVGRYVVDFAKEELRDVYHRLMKRVRDGKETVKNFQGNLLHKDGTERLFDINCAPNLDSEENITGLVANLKDITEQHLLEAQLHHASKMEAIGTLTGGISHDFNNILQALNGYTQLLFINKEKTDRDWHYLVNIEEMIERATNLTRQLLLFSRKADIKPEPLDFNNEIRKCFDILSQTITKMITIKLDLAADLGIINGDATQMGQIIMNLILNSRDAMPEGGTVTITSDNEEVREDLIFDDVKIESGKYVKISVSDTGMGMTREVKNRIFEPFFTTKDGKGTGLGLPVVYGIVKNHNGVITCHSELGRGSTFTVYLPRIDAHEKIASKTKAISSEQRLAGKETIFIVDDEEMLLETGKAFLDQYGYKILTARNGEEAVEIFAHRKEDIDLVLLDLIMPGMGGHKCLEGLLQIDPSIPVVITSGYTAGIDAQEIIKRGAAGFINKPYKLQTLIMEIRRILDQSKRKHSAEGGNETDIAQLTLF
jgi:PAS domain S-box-containing protein